MGKRNARIGAEMIARVRAEREAKRSVEERRMAVMLAYKMLGQGCSIRSVAELAGVSFDLVTKVLLGYNSLDRRRRKQIQKHRRRRTG